MQKLICRVKVPRSFIAERNYLCSVIFNEFIDLPYDLVVDDTLVNTYSIGVNDGEIVFIDDFFSRTNEDRSYLLESLIPTRVETVSVEFAPDKDIPLLFGKPEIATEPQVIRCGHDIFASIFYMLTRWEEAVIANTDYLKRFPASESLAVKFNFLHRPVVNEWVEMLANMIRHFVPSWQIKRRQSHQIIFTHDIDFLNSPVTLREFAKDIFKRKSVSAFTRRIKYFAQRENPHNMFNYFMDVSEKHNTVSRFNFMTGHNVPGKDGESYNKSKLYKATLKRIKERGHTIGFHPSLNSYDNPQMFRREKALLEKDAGRNVTEGRQHALRFRMPYTWKMWEGMDMEIDSTLGYSAQEGFRCGTGCIFSTFDVEDRKPMRLMEMPLVIMDTTLHVNKKLGIEESANIIRMYLQCGKRFDMPITLLFHNSIDEEIDWNGWKNLYDELFNQ
jgi:hypothetical protein